MKEGKRIKKRLSADSTARCTWVMVCAIRMSVGFTAVFADVRLVVSSPFYKLPCGARYNTAMRLMGCTYLTRRRSFRVAWMKMCTRR